MSEKIQGRRAHAIETAASYTNDFLIKAYRLAFVVGSWLLYDACAAEIQRRGLVVA